MKNKTIYRAPAYLQLAAKRKCNKDDIFIVGVTDYELFLFRYSMKYHAISVTRPEEKGRAVVAIESRCHKNTAEFAVDEIVQPQSTSDRELSESKTPEDWFDEFTITNKKDKGKQTNKSFQLQLQSSTTKTGGFNFQVAGAGFFNAVAPSGGVSGSYATTTGKTSTYESGITDLLSQGYEIADVLKIPPKTKVKATISTWVVTYESEVVTEVSVDAKAALDVRYRPSWSRKYFGGAFTRTVKITAKELFRNEMDYECKDDTVTFKRVGYVSHLGEEVEIIKERDPCNKEEELKRKTAPARV